MAGSSRVWRLCAVALAMAGVAHAVGPLPPIGPGGHFPGCPTALAGFAGPDSIPVAQFRDAHWTPIGTRPFFSSESGNLDPAPVRELSQRYHDIFSSVGARPDGNRFVITGLRSWVRSPEREGHAIRGLSEGTRNRIDRWASEVLRLARAATGEDLVIENVSLGVGFAANGGGGPLIHSDGPGTYLHAIATLQGDSPYVFPTANAVGLSGHIITGRDAATGVLTIQRPRQPETARTVPGGISLSTGDTVLINGADYRTAHPDARATMHSSPLGVTMDRVSLYISLEPRRVP